MPTYQYVCPKCNMNFELRQGFNDESVANCPKCSGEARRLFIPVPIIFKGSGFYVTDSRTTSEAQMPPKESTSATENVSSKVNDNSRKAAVNSSAD